MRHPNDEIIPNCILEVILEVFWNENPSELTSIFRTLSRTIKREWLVKLFLDDLQRTSEIEKFENDVDQNNLYEDEARPYDLDRQSPIKEPQIDMSIMPDLSAQYEVRFIVLTMESIQYSGGRSGSGQYRRWIQKE